MVFKAIGNFFGGIGKGIWNGLKKVFRAIFGPIISFFELVICFFKNLPRIILEFLKWITLWLIDFFLLNDVMKHPTTALVYLVVWLFFTVIRAVRGLFVMAIVFLFFLLYVFLLGGTTEIIRKLWISLATCKNGPRHWYSISCEHFGNGTIRLIPSLLPCMKSCQDGYRPRFLGLVCARLPIGAPRLCPNAGITELVDRTFDPPDADKRPKLSGTRAYVSGGGKETFLQKHFEECEEQTAGLSESQKVLAERACWQPQMFGDEGINFCYDQRCLTDRADVPCAPLSAAIAAREPDARVQTNVSIMITVAFVSAAALGMLFGLRFLINRGKTRQFVQS